MAVLFCLHDAQQVYLHNLEAVYISLEAEQGMMDT